MFFVVVFFFHFSPFLPTLIMSRFLIWRVKLASVGKVLSTPLHQRKLSAHVTNFAMKYGLPIEFPLYDNGTIIKYIK
jgi:hypothetical protein